MASTNENSRGLPNVPENQQQQPWAHQLNEKNQKALESGGLDRLQKIRDSGRLTARDRIEALLDQNTFVEVDRLKTHRCQDFGLGDKKIYGDGVITGFGEIQGRKVFVFSQDFTVFGGSLSSAHAEKICKIMDLATKAGCPLIGINDSGGARIQEGVDSLGGYAEIFWRNTQVSGVIPQISVIMGPCAGGAVYSPAMTDFIFMVDSSSYMFVTGPEVIKTVTHEEVTKEKLGGSVTHAATSGVCHARYPSEISCLNGVRDLMSYLPQNNLDPVPSPHGLHGNAGHQNLEAPRECEKIESIIPLDSKKPYDIRHVISDIVDTSTFFEIHRDFAKNIVVGFARLGGKSIGVVANQPMILAGCLDIDASTKAARFVRFCDAFNIPLVTLVDVPGFLPGTQQEFGGIIRHGAKLLYAFAEATVPKLTIITRKAYGGAYDVMASKHIRADFNFAYPWAEIAVMGAEGAINILYKKQLSEAQDPNALRSELAENYRNTFASPYKAAELGFIDGVIDPKETRNLLISCLDTMKTKREKGPFRKHGNIPL